MLVTVLSAVACSRSGATRDSAAAAESARASSSGTTASAASADSALVQPTQASAARASGSATPPVGAGAARDTGRRPSPADARPSDTRPSIPANPPSISPAAGSDTIRGTPAVVGTSFQSRVVLQPAGGGRSIPLEGPQAKLIGALSGADVWVSGTRDASGTFTVSRFAVRSVDGAPAIDGVLRMTGDRLELVAVDGSRHAIARPSPALRQQVGARVWITGAASGPLVFGVIEKNP